MSDEEAVQHADDEEHQAQAKAAASNLESDDLVEARFSVTVMPQESVSAHFQVAPKDEKNAVTSVTVSFVKQHNGMVTHSFGGSTVQELLAPRDGQGAAGDSGVDVAVFAGNDDEGDHFVVLAGTVRTEEGPQNFYFSRQFYL